MFEYYSPVNITTLNWQFRCIDLRGRIQTITENEYAQAKEDVDKLRKELGQSPIQSIQETLNQRESAWLESVRKSKSQGPVGHITMSDGPPLLLHSVATPQMIPEAGPSTPLVMGSKKRSASFVEQSPLTAFNPTLTPTPTFEPPLKRPRGRPKGSKNKAKLHSVQTPTAPTMTSPVVSNAMSGVLPTRPGAGMGGSGSGSAESSSGAGTEHSSSHF